jgi:hypothetical protein
MGGIVRSTSGITRTITSTFDFESKKEYWIFYSELENSVTTYKALVYNYERGVWYKMSGLTECACPILISGKLYMFGSEFSYFDDALKSDIEGNGTQTEIVAYAETPYLSFGRDFNYKKIQKLFATLSNNTDFDSYLRLRYWADKEIYQETEFFLGAGDPPVPKVKTIDARRFNYMKFRFISDRTDNVCKLINYTVKMQYSGEVK